MEAHDLHWWLRAFKRIQTWNTWGDMDFMDVHSAQTVRRIRDRLADQGIRFFENRNDVIRFVEGDGQDQVAIQTRFAFVVELQGYINQFTRSFEGMGWPTLDEVHVHIMRSLLSWGGDPVTPTPRLAHLWRVEDVPFLVVPGPENRGLDDTQECRALKQQYKDSSEGLKRSIMHHHRLGAIPHLPEFLLTCLPSNDAVYTDALSALRDRVRYTLGCVVYSGPPTIPLYLYNVMTSILFGIMEVKDFLKSPLSQQSSI